MTTGTVEILSKNNKRVLRIEIVSDTSIKGKLIGFAELSLEEKNEVLEKKFENIVKLLVK